MATYQLVAGTFEGESAEATARATAKAVSKAFPHLHDRNVALLVRDSRGELVITETAEVREAQQEIVAGSVLGWLGGFATTLVGGPLGPGQAGPLGGALGTEASATHDTGFADAFLNELGAALANGQAAVLAAATSEDAPALLDLLKQHGATASARPLTPESLADNS